MHDRFGGAIIALSHSGDENHQQAYEWHLKSYAAITFIRLIRDSLLLKKREADVYLEYHDGGKVDKVLLERLSELKHVAHDDIPETVQPSIAYFGGFTDGEGCLDTHGKSQQHHGINQSWRPICDVFQRRFGGTICWSGPPNNVFKWSIHTFAADFLRDVAPYIVGKKAQVDLILNMKPGEAMDVHCKLRELKGNIGHATPKIDKWLAGERPEYTYEPKKLPRGVHEWNGKYKVMLRRDKVEYNLGSFATVEEAEAQYKKYKKMVDAEKRGGPKVDLEFNTRKNRLLKLPPPPADFVRPKGVYVTKFNTYQVRYHGGGKKVQLGTYKTVEEAQKAYNDYAASLTSS